MTLQERWFIEHRGEALALLYLTRRDDLIVTRDYPDYGIDLLVEVLNEQHRTGRRFGVEIKVRRQAHALTQKFIHTLVTPPQQKLLESLPFPVCLFFFTMHDDAGYYQWLSAPVVTSEAEPLLRKNTLNDLKGLDNDSLATIVTQVNGWYDALHRSLAA